MKCDTQEIEGTVRLVTGIGERCPNISHQLLSSRITIKKQLGLAALSTETSREKKWVDIKPLAAAIIDDGLQHRDAMRDVLGQADRWGSAMLSFDPKCLPRPLPPPPPGLDELSAAAAASSTAEDTPEDTLKNIAGWSKAYQLTWHQTFSESSVCKAFRIGHAKLSEGNIVYLCIEKLYSSGTLVRCRVGPAAEASGVSQPTLMLEVAMPLEMVESQDLFAKQHRAAMASERGIACYSFKVGAWGMVKQGCARVGLIWTRSAKEVLKLQKLKVKVKSESKSKSKAPLAGGGGDLGGDAAAAGDTSESVAADTTMAGLSLNGFQTMRAGRAVQLSTLSTDHDFEI